MKAHVAEGQGMIASFTVAPPAMRGRPADPVVGADEGEQCLRLDGRGKTCLGFIWYEPDALLGSCVCHMGHPPCGYCVSTDSECSDCGWRNET